MAMPWACEVKALTGTSINTECGWDHLYVFDGDSVFSDLKAVYSGMVKSNHYSIQRVPEIIGESGTFWVNSIIAYGVC